jgi:hypothetical protein
MAVSGKDLLLVNAAVGRQWLKLLVESIHWYAALLDPRPDLGVPARKIRTPYIWWW